MEKIAIISDIHGNFEAIKKVLLDIKNRGIDKIICLGDIIAKGTHPNECINLIRDNCFVVISGNTDRYFTQQHDLEALPELERQRNCAFSTIVVELRGEVLYNNDSYG